MMEEKVLGKIWKTWLLIIWMWLYPPKVTLKLGSQQRWRVVALRNELMTFLRNYVKVLGSHRTKPVTGRMMVTRLHHCLSPLTHTYTPAYYSDMWCHIHTHLLNILTYVIYAHTHTYLLTIDMWCHIHMHLLTILIYDVIATHILAYQSSIWCHIPMYPLTILPCDVTGAMTLTPGTERKLALCPWTSRIVI